jgi:uncharacterized protein DUF5317
VIGLAAPVVLALVVGLAMGGSRDRLRQYRVRWWPLAFAALAIQLPLYSPPFNAWPAVVSLGPIATIATTSLVLAMLIRNVVDAPRAAGILAALGLTLNLTVIVANGGWMPRADQLAPRLMDRAGVAGALTNTAPIMADSKLAWLGDIVPQPDWVPLANLVSPGDLLLSIGAAWWAFALTRRRPAAAWSTVDG